MQLVEQHVIRKGDSRYEAIDQAAFASKNVYNAANYLIRQAFIFQGIYLNYNQMHHMMKTHPAYQALPRKVSQQVLRTLDRNAGHRQEPELEAGSGNGQEEQPAIRGYPSRSFHRDVGL